MVSSPKTKVKRSKMLKPLTPEKVAAWTQKRTTSGLLVHEQAGLRVTHASLLKPKGTDNLPANDAMAGQILSAAHAIFVTTSRQATVEDLNVLKYQDYGLNATGRDNGAADNTAYETGERVRNMVLVNALNDAPEDNDPQARSSMLGKLSASIDSYCDAQLVPGHTLTEEQVHDLDALRANARVFLVNADATPGRCAAFVEDIRRLLTHQAVATFMQVTQTASFQLKRFLTVKISKTELAKATSAIEKRIRKAQQQNTMDADAWSAKLRPLVRAHVLERIGYTGGEVNVWDVLLSAVDNELQRFVFDALKRAHEMIAHESGRCMENGEANGSQTSSNPYRNHAEHGAAADTAAAAAGTAAEPSAAASAMAADKGVVAGDTVFELAAVYLEGLEQVRQAAATAWRNIKEGYRRSEVQKTAVMASLLQLSFDILEKTSDNADHVQRAVRHVLGQLHAQAEARGTSDLSPRQGGHVVWAIDEQFRNALSELVDTTLATTQSLIEMHGDYLLDISCGSLLQGELSAEAEADLQSLQQGLTELCAQNCQYETRNGVSRDMIATLAFSGPPQPSAAEVLQLACAPSRMQRANAAAAAAAAASNESGRREGEEVDRDEASAAGGEACIPPLTLAGNPTLVDFRRQSSYKVEYTAPPGKHDARLTQSTEPELPSIVVSFAAQTMEFKPSAEAEELLRLFGTRSRQTAEELRKAPRAQHQTIAPATLVVVEAVQVPAVLPNVLVGEQPHTAEQTLMHLTVLVVPMELRDVAQDRLMQLVQAQRASGETEMRVLLLLLPAGTLNAALGFEVAQALYTQQRLDCWWALPLNFHAFHEYRRYTLRSRRCTPAFAMTYLQGVVATLERHATSLWAAHLRTKISELIEADVATYTLLARQLLETGAVQTHSLFELTRQLLASDAATCSMDKSDLAWVFAPLCNLLRLCGVYMESSAFFGDGHSQRGVVDYTVRRAWTPGRRKVAFPLLVCSVSSEVVPFAQDMAHRDLNSVAVDDERDSNAVLLARFDRMYDALKGADGSVVPWPTFFCSLMIASECTL